MLFWTVQGVFVGGLPLGLFTIDLLKDCLGIVALLLVYLFLLSLLLPFFVISCCECDFTTSVFEYLHFFKGCVRCQVWNFSGVNLFILDRISCLSC